MCLNDSMCKWKCAELIIDGIDQWCETHGLQGGKGKKLKV